MFSRSNCITVFIAALFLCVSSFAVQAQTAAADSAPTGVLRGHITDPTGALIPGAEVTVTTTKGQVAGKATADAAGGFAVHGLAAGDYVVQAEFQGFATFVSKPIPLEAGQTKNVDIKMALEAAQQQVEVTAEGTPTVNTDADSNASAVVLKGKDLDALSDDPDELSNELQALAGPSAGPNGGQIYIDGFTGGQLPPKSAIREIRINQNPFSAEFDRLGYGRIEILTKPGTDQLHGRVFALGNDDTFNTGNPFTKNVPSYHSIQSNETLSGRMSKNSSFFVSVEQRNTQDASIYTADIPVQDPSTGQWYIPKNSSGAIIPTSGGLFSPQSRLEISPRFDFQLGQKNTLTMRYQFWRSHTTGQIGSTSLPSENATSQIIEHTVQLDDTQVISDHLVNETRFEYRYGTNWEAPVSDAPTVKVPGYFSSGGNASQSSSGHANHFELQEFVTMSAGRHALKFGTWMRDNRQATSTSSGFNGTFNFPSIEAYTFTQNHLNEIGTPQFNADCTAAQASEPALASGCLPNKLTYVTGPYAFRGNLFDAAFYFQDDWKFSRFLTLSGGLRFETQNHVTDHADFAPRFAFAYALDGHKDQKQAKTVLRGGFGFFYDRFQIPDLMNLEQYSGIAGASQFTTVISNPQCFDGNSLNNIDGGDPNNLPGACGARTTATSTIDTVTPGYHSPYSEQGGLSVERQLTRTSTMTLTYVHSFGVHQMVVRDANPYQPVTPGSDYYSAAAGLPRLNPNEGIVDQYFPEAVFKQNQLILNVNGQITRNFSMGGFYNWTRAFSDGGAGSNPSNSYNLSQDYGRASFVRPQFLFLMGSYNAPWGITFNPFVVAEAGRPYNITTAQDLTGDNFFNDRPAYASSSSNPAKVAQTSFGTLDTAPTAGEVLIPSELANASASMAFNLRVSRSFGLGPLTEGAGGSSHMGGGPGGGHHGGPGGFGGGIFGGGGHGGFHGGMSNTGHKYSLTFSAQALNLFNNVNYGTPSGTVIPTADGSGLNGPGPRFGTSTKLAGGMFASPTGSASRRIFVQAFFSF